MLYKLNKAGDTEDFSASYEKVKRTDLATIGWREKDLENLISNNLPDFISSNDLMPIYTERPWKEAPDILALDSDGDLYIFELKRWSGKQENILQVLRYGQLFGKSSYTELNDLYNKYLGEEVDLQGKHSNYFGRDKEDLLDKEAFNKRQHFLVVTNGLDQTTVEAITYWRNIGVDINAIVYWVFEINNEHYIEFNTYSQVEDFLEYENRSYIVNTNKSNDPKAAKEMLTEKKAAAYSQGWRELIKKLQKDDIVFLYETGVGIRAYGRASGDLKKKDRDGKKDYEYYMHLNGFKELKHPLSASKIKEITGHSNFRRALNPISDERSKKLTDYIEHRTRGVLSVSDISDA